MERSRLLGSTPPAQVAVEKGWLPGSECSLGGAGASSAPLVAVLQSVARAVWRNDRRTAEALVKTKSLAARHLDTASDVVFLKCPLAFSEEFAAAKLQELSRDLAVKIGTKAPSHRVEAALRKQQLRSPFGKSLRLSALRCRDGTVATERQQVMDEFVAAWAPKFASVEVDEVEARRVGATWVRQLDRTGCSPPCAADFLAAALRSRCSAPGPDGFYSA